MRRPNSGFTLFELVTVIAIMAIIGSLGTVSLLGFKKRHQALSLANLIKADLNRGKILAAKYKSNVVLQLQDGFYELFVDNGAGEATPDDWLREGKEICAARRSIAPSLSLTSNFPGDHLRLRSIGRIRPGKLTIEGRSGPRIDVVISAVGRVRLEYGES